MSLFLPSYDNGFAPRDFAPEYPELWDGLVGAWCPSLGATGTSLFDQSGYGENGTLNNFTLSTAWANPAVNGLVFDGIDDYVAVSDNPSLNLARMSVAAWVYPISLNNNGSWFNRRTASNNSGYTLEPNGTGGVQFHVTIGSYGFKVVSESLGTLNAWSFYVGTYDGATVRLYKNGKEIANLAATGDPSVSSATCLIGKNVVNSTVFNGWIRGVIVASRAYTASEVALLNSIGPEGLYTPSSRQASLIPNISATGNRRRRVIIGAA